MATVVVGDSHVFWLHRFRRENDLPGIIEDNGNGPIKFIGVRGGTVRSLSSPGVIETIAKLSPAIVVIHVGGNDIDNARGFPPQGVGMQIYELAKRYRAEGVKQVVVCQIVRREKWRHFSFQDGTQAAIMANEFLEAACAGCPGITFWKHKGLWSSVRPAFRPDGVHVNELGNYKLLRSIRGSILWATKRLNV